MSDNAFRWAVYYKNVKTGDSDDDMSFKLKSDPVLEVKDPFSGYWSKVPIVEVEETEENNK